MATNECITVETVVDSPYPTMNKKYINEAELILSSRKFDEERFLAHRVLNLLPDHKYMEATKVYEKKLKAQKQKHPMSISNTPQVVTKAFLKLENCFEILKQRGRDVKTAVFLAELPGASIFALKYVYPECEWFANSAYRGEHFLTDDHFRLLADYPERWIGYKDNSTGNLMYEIVRKEIHQFVRDRGLKVDLVSADGGAGTYSFANYMRFSERYNVMHHLMHVIWVVAESILAEGGAFILKVYNTISHTPTINLMTTIVAHFDEVVLVKPMASNMTNDEFYYVFINRLPAPRDFTACERVISNALIAEQKKILIHELSSVLMITEFIRSMS